MSYLPELSRQIRLEILSSKVMADFVSQCRKEFDLIIFDTTPLLGLADPYLLSEYTDGVVIVVPLNQIKRSVFGTHC